MNHCSVNINVNYNNPTRLVEEEFDHLVGNIDFGSELCLKLLIFCEIKFINPRRMRERGLQ